MSAENKNITYVDHLSEDAPLAGQKFVCVSIVTPSGDQKCDVSGIKIRGSYPTEEEARKRAAYLQKVDPLFNIYVAPVGCFLPIIDNPEKVNDIEYQDKQLNAIVKDYKENQQKSQELFEKNKQEMKQKAEDMKSDEYRLEKSKLEYDNAAKELKASVEKIKDLEKLLESLKDSLKSDFDFDVDAALEEKVSEAAKELEGAKIQEL